MESNSVERWAGGKLSVYRGLQAQPRPERV